MHIDNSAMKEARSALQREATAQAIVAIARELKRQGHDRDDAQIIVAIAFDCVFGQEGQVFDIEDHLQKRRVVDLVHSTCERLRRLGKTAPSRQFNMEGV